METRFKVGDYVSFESMVREGKERGTILEIVPACRVKTDDNNTLWVYEKNCETAKPMNKYEIAIERLERTEASKDVVEAIKALKELVCDTFKDTAIVDINTLEINGTATLH